MKRVFSLLSVLLLSAVLAAHAGSCITDLEGAVADVGTAAKDISAAVSACKTSKDACVAAIGVVVNDLSTATQVIDSAAQDCAGLNAVCAADVSKIATDLSAVSQVWKNAYMYVCMYMYFMFPCV
jgi:hypothetical protein